MPVRSKTKAEKQAVKIWERSGKPMPVSSALRHIVEICEIELLYGELETVVSGMMVSREDSSSVIVVNKEHHENRQHFTIAHELGHYFLHRNSSPIFVDSTTAVFYRDPSASEGTKLQEIEANAFAAELLMPEEEVRKRFVAPLTLMDMHEIDHVAAVFEVSTTALTHRLTRLGILSNYESDD